MRTTACILAAAVAAIPSFVHAADAAAPADTAALKAQIEALQQQVGRIEAAQAAAAERDTTAAAVANDAARQSQFLQTQPFSAGWNNGFKLQSADGNYVLQPGLILQFRNITNWNTANDEIENGFEFRRVRPRIDGVVFTKDLSYSLVLDVARNSGSVSLLDAWMKYQFDKEWSLKFGQFRNTWVHEGDVSDTKQLAVERSLVDATLAGSQTDRVQGVELGYASQEIPLRAAVSFNDGANSKNTDFRDSDGAADAATTARVDSNFGVAGRVEYKFFGDWKDYSDLTAKSVKQDLLVAGAGTFISQNGDTTVSRFVADVQYGRTDGWTAFGQLVYVYNTADESSNYGATGQVGYLVNPKVEVFGRYSYLNFENEINGEDNFHEITAGVNYYFGKDGAWGNNAKFTLDVNYLPTGSPGAQTGVGYLAGDENQIVVRAQFQLVL